MALNRMIRVSGSIHHQDAKNRPQDAA